MKNFKISKIGLLIFLIVNVTFTFGTGFSYENTVENVQQLPIGQQAPDFQLENLNTNTSFKLSDNTGKVVIIDLFATWCGPCKAALPQIRRVFFSYSQDDLCIISIDTDSKEGENLVRPFAETYKMDWNVALDNNSIVDTNYGSGYIPTMYIIAPNQTIVYSEIGFYYDRVTDVIDSMIEGDQNIPQLSNYTIENKVLSLEDNIVNVELVNVSDNYGIYQIQSKATNGLKSATFDLFKGEHFVNFSESYEVIIDQKILYLQTTITLSIHIFDFIGNELIINKTFSAIPTDEDLSDPEIHSVKVDYVIDGTKAYNFTIKANITDDVYVYAVDFWIRDKNGFKSFTSYMKRENNSSSIFNGFIRLTSSDIYQPDTALARIKAVDIVDNEKVWNFEDGDPFTQYKDYQLAITPESFVKGKDIKLILNFTENEKFELIEGVDLLVCQLSPEYLCESGSKEMIKDISTSSYSYTLTVEYPQNSIVGFHFIISLTDGTSFTIPNGVEEDSEFLDITKTSDGELYFALTVTSSQASSIDIVYLILVFPLLTKKRKKKKEKLFT